LLSSGNCDTNSNQYSNEYTHCNPDKHAHADPDQYPDGYSDQHPNCHSDGYAHEHADAHSDADCNADEYAAPVGDPNKYPGAPGGYSDQHAGPADRDPDGGSADADGNGRTACAHIYPNSGAPDAHSHTGPAPGAAGGPAAASAPDADPD